MRGTHSCLADELRAQDAVLCEEHVLPPDPHPVGSLGSESSCERPVAVEVLLEGASLYGGVAVARECAGEDGLHAH